MKIKATITNLTLSRAELTVQITAEGRTSTQSRYGRGHPLMLTVPSHLGKGYRLGQTIKITVQPA